MVESRGLLTVLQTPDIFIAVSCFYPQRDWVLDARREVTASASKEKTRCRCSIMITPLFFCVILPPHPPPPFRSK